MCVFLQRVCLLLFLLVCSAALFFLEVNLFLIHLYALQILATYISPSHLHSQGTVWGLMCLQWGSAELLFRVKHLRSGRNQLVRTLLLNENWSREKKQQQLIDSVHTQTLRLIFPIDTHTQTVFTHVLPLSLLFHLSEHSKSKCLYIASTAHFFDLRVKES